jgi:hypothetical protein
MLTDLRTFWQPHLDGKQDLATALRAVVEHAPRRTPDPLSGSVRLAGAERP